MSLPRSIYQASSGAWVFNAGTNQWSWGLDDYFTGLVTADGANNAARSSFTEEFEVVIMIESVTEEMHGSN